MVDLPTFTNLSASQVAVLLDAFKPYEGATTAEAVREYKAWLRAKLQAEVQRRLYAKLHTTPDLQAQEQTINANVSASLPDPKATFHSASASGGIEWDAHGTG